MFKTLLSLPALLRPLLKKDLVSEQDGLSSRTAMLQVPILLIHLRIVFPMLPWQPAKVRRTLFTLPIQMLHQIRDCQLTCPLIQPQETKMLLRDTLELDQFMITLSVLLPPLLETMSITLPKLLKVPSSKLMVAKAHSTAVFLSSSSPTNNKDNGLNSQIAKVKPERSHSTPSMSRTLPLPLANHVNERIGWG